MWSPGTRMQRGSAGRGGWRAVAWRGGVRSGLDRGADAQGCLTHADVSAPPAWYVGSARQPPRGHTVAIWPSDSGRCRTASAREPRRPPPRPPGAWTAWLVPEQFICPAPRHPSSAGSGSSPSTRLTRGCCSPRHKGAEVRAQFALASILRLKPSPSMSSGTGADAGWSGSTTGVSSLKWPTLLAAALRLVEVLLAIFVALLRGP